MSTTNTNRNDRILIPSAPPTPLPPKLLQTLISALLSPPTGTSAIPHIQSALSNNAKAAGWNEAVHKRAKEIIESGQAGNVKEVMEVLVREAMVREGKGKGLKKVGGGGGGGGVRFPDEAIEAGRKVVRDALEGIVDVEGNGGKS
ncbi:MAG: hypothetical protein Q9221_008525 [Calogaya cf. arnoldii]